MESRSLLQVSRPCLGEAEARAAERTLAAGYLGMGPETRAFEIELAAFFGNGRKVVTASTGTSALHLALAALGVGAGDEVLVPSLTFVASFQAIAVTGARPIACDVRDDCGLLDLEDASRKITARTRAIMPVHYAGFADDLDAVHRFACEAGLRVIEDAAHAFGSRCRSRLVGSFGDIACFSFDPIKNITCGQGGAVVTADASVARAAGRMRNLAIESIAGAAGDAIEVRGPGWRYAMSDLNAAIGRVQLARFESELKPHRQRLAARYRQRLESIPGLGLLRSEPDVVPHIFPVRVRGGRRDAARVALATAGFESVVHYKPSHLLSAFRAEDCPTAERLYRELLTLPLHAAVQIEDVDRIAAVLGDALGR